MRDRLTLIIKTGRDARKAVALSGLREGILPDWHIRALADAGQLLPAEPFVEAQVQPASLDLRLGNRAYRVRARDKSANQNPTGYSSTETASTPPSSCNATSTHVTSIVVSTFGIGRGQKRGRAIVTLGDNCGDPVAGATVDGTFSESFSESPSGTTDSSGAVTFSID